MSCALARHLQHHNKCYVVYYPKADLILKLLCDSLTEITENLKSKLS